MRGMMAHVLLRLVCSLSDGLAGLLLRNVQEKPHQRLNAAPDRGEVDALVGPVDVVLREAETGEHRVDTEKILKFADNRYPGSNPIKKRSRPPGFFEGPAERRNSGRRAVGEGGAVAAPQANLGSDSLRRVRLHVAGELLVKLRWILVRDEAGGHVGFRGGGNGAGRPASPHLQDVERWPGRGALDGRVAPLPPKGWRAGVLQIVGIILGQARKLRPLVFADLADLVVEARDRHAAIGVVEAGDHLAQDVDRVEDYPAEDAVGDVIRRPGNPNTAVHPATKPKKQRRRTLADHSPG